MPSVVVTVGMTHSCRELGANHQDRLGLTLSEWPMTLFSGGLIVVVRTQFGVAECQT